jgi:hypothetical protein
MRDSFFVRFHIWQLAAVSHSVTFISTIHVVIVILYNGQLQVIYAVIKKATFYWWIMNMFQNVHIKLVLPNLYWHVTTCCDPNVTSFQFQYPDTKFA